MASHTVARQKLFTNDLWNMPNITVRIDKGPPFTQGPHAIQYIVSSDLDFVGFREDLIKQISVEDKLATVGLQIRNIKVKNDDGLQIKDKTTFADFLLTQPTMIAVEIVDFTSPGKHSFSCLLIYCISHVVNLLSSSFDHQVSSTILILFRPIVNASLCFVDRLRAVSELWERLWRSSPLARTFY